MSYLMGEMLIYLVGVTVLGIIVGWLFTRASYHRRIEDAEVVLLGQVHEVTNRLDITQEQLKSTTDSLDQERASKTGNILELERLQSELLDSKSQFDDRKQQALDQDQSLEEANKQLKITETKLEEQLQKNHKMTGDFEALSKRLTIFHSDLDEIAEQSGILRSAFEKARLDLVTKDKRLAELESMPNEGLQMAALSGTTEPELAISRIARLQTRVQELFEEVDQKDKELEQLKTSGTISEQKPGVTSIAGLQADDLQQIGGIGDSLEEKLNEMGITRFSDIASWDDTDIDRIDKDLDFHGRIRRENWVEQAQKLSQSRSSNYRGH